jgi:hypothetical protein
MLYNDTNFITWAHDFFSALENTSGISLVGDIVVNNGYFFNISGVIIDPRQTNTKYMANLFFSQKTILIHISRLAGTTGSIVFEHKVDENVSILEVVSLFTKAIGFK